MKTWRNRVHTRLPDTPREPRGAANRAGPWAARKRRRPVFLALAATLLLSALAGCGVSRSYDRYGMFGASASNASATESFDNAETPAAPAETTQGDSYMSASLTVLNQCVTLILQILCVYVLVQAIRYFKQKTSSSREKASDEVKQNNASPPKRAENAQPASQTAAPGTRDHHSSFASDAGMNMDWENGGAQLGRAPGAQPPRQENMRSLSAPRESSGAPAAWSDQSTGKAHDAYDQTARGKLSSTPPTCFFDVRNEQEIRNSLNGGVLPAFRQTTAGSLVGRRMPDGCYAIVPASEELTEAELNYSPVKLCFHIEQESRSGKKFKVRATRPAILHEDSPGVYRIKSSGDLEIVETYPAL